jgi:HAD superfamily hydrolase (TIGR01549 family)
LRIRAVFFDIGETLIDETRAWSLLADWLAVPRMTMFGVLGGLIAEGRDHRELFDIVRPDIGWKGVVARFSTEVDDRFLREDLYPDVVPCLENLNSRGHFVGIAGNQPITQDAALRSMNLPAALIATSAGWGIKKPDQAFFERIVRETGFKADEIVYVGDRVDNDIVPAAAAGLVPVHIVRGPWGYLQRNSVKADRARAQLKTLIELPDVLEQL